MEDNLQADLIKPRRKRRRFTKLEFPFPVPLNKDNTSNIWYYYEGYLRCNSVVVENVGDFTFLYKMGFFGKGIMSRSKPEYEKISNISQLAFSNSDKLRRLPPNERTIRQSKFKKCRKERFCQHLSWSKLSRQMNQHGSDEETSVSDDESPLTSEEQIVNDDCDSKEVGGSEENRGIDQDEEEDVRIDDVILDLVNKEPKLSQDTESTGKRLKPDPYQVYECLQLTLEEAFFLSFGLGCLSILKANQKLSLSMLWSEFCERNPDFFRNYIAYHYYRSKGWVPQVGLKYGTDLVLYKKGMPFFHSSYAVVTTLVNDEGKRSILSDNVSSGQEWTWKNLASLNRLNEHVAKELLLCSITVPSGRKEECLKNPHSIKDFTVQETIVRRWIPKRARESSSED